VSEHASVSTLSKATVDLANEFDRSSPDVSAETVPLPNRLRDLCRITPPTGPFDACQLTLTRPSMCPCGHTADRLGLPPPAAHVS